MTKHLSEKLLIILKGNFDKKNLNVVSIFIFVINMVYFCLDLNNLGALP